MTPLRTPFATLASAMVVLLLVATPASADLTVHTYEGATFSIHTQGSSTLAAPRNATIEPLWGGYLVDWAAPTPPAGQQLSGYTVYRIPAPGTEGPVTTTDLGPRWSAFYDKPGEGTYVYFVTALFGEGASESIPSDPVSTSDTTASGSTSGTSSTGSTSTASSSRVGTSCHIVGVYLTPPYYDVHIDCLFSLS